MSTCKLPSFEELNNAVKNKKYIQLNLGSTQQDTANAIREINNMFELKDQNVPGDKLGDDRRRYTLRDTVDTFLAGRVTDKVSMLYQRIYGNRGKNQAAQSSDNAEYGTVVHDVLSDTMNMLFDNYKNGTAIDYKAIRAKHSTGKYKLTDAQVNSLISGAKELLDTIKEYQDRIDPNQKFELLTENVIIHPVSSTGGTVDVLVIFSDNTAGVFDFKSFSIDSMFTTYDPVKRKKEITSGDFIAKSKRDGWKIQMSSYKKILLENYNVKDVRFTRIV